MRIIIFKSPFQLFLQVRMEGRWISPWTHVEGPMESSCTPGPCFHGLWTPSFQHTSRSWTVCKLLPPLPMSLTLSVFPSCSNDYGTADFLPNFFLLGRSCYGPQQSEYCHKAIDYFLSSLLPHWTPRGVPADTNTMEETHGLMLAKLRE